MKFIDRTEIRIRSGRGGPGMVSFRSAKNLPKLGADGGDGGFGGSVYLVGEQQLNTLSGLYYKQLYAAEDGRKGGTNNCTGRNGADLEVKVPIGTIAYDKDTGEVLGEVLEHEQKILVAEGGKRGLGNLRYLSSRHQAPEEHTQGGPAVELMLRLELKILADVGLAGFPNAGKSTFLSVISAARPKVADYPFTTLEPQLGVVDLQKLTGQWGESIVVADIPGLIEGASEGRGLGHEFLRHLERTKVICYVIDPYDLEGRDAADAFAILKEELNKFAFHLGQKDFLVALTKADLRESSFETDKLLAEFQEQGICALAISSASGLGINELKLQLWKMVKAAKDKVQVEVDEQAAQLRRDDRANKAAKYQQIGDTADSDLLGFS
ncbi:MAG: Obg family GTPase CgtA [Oligoflexus sp.]